MQLLVIVDSAAGSRRLTESLQAARVSAQVTTPGLLAESSTLSELDTDGVVIDTADLAGIALPLLRRLREGGHRLPMLLLAAPSGRAEAEAFNLGADAVLPRSAPAATLLARIEAIRRRAPARKAAALRCGNVSIDRDAGTLSVAGAVVEVTPCELRVLEMLMAARGAILSKERICEALHEGPGEADAAPGVLRVFVCRLRRKLAASGADDIIRTVWGVGYRVEHVRPARPAGIPVAPFAGPQGSDWLAAAR